MKKVLIFGTFDKLHKGHLFFIEKARLYGDHLIAVVATDSYIQEYKNQSPLNIQEKRIRKLKETNLINEVVSSDKEDNDFSVVEKYNPDVIILGYDQQELEKALNLWLRKSNKNIVVKRLTNSFKPHQYKTGIIRKKRILIAKFLVCLTMLIWAMGWLSARFVNIKSSSPHDVIIFWRMVLTTLFFIPFFFREKVKYLLSDSSIFIWGSALASVFYNIFYFKGLFYLPASKGGIFFSVILPIFTYLFSFVFFREIPSRRKMIGLLLGLFSGLLMMELFNVKVVYDMRGFLFLTIASFLWTVLSFLGWRGQRNLPLFSYSFYLYLFSSFIQLLIVLLHNHFSLLFDVSLLTWGIILFFSLGISVIGTTFYFYAIRLMGAKEANNFILLIPIFDALLSTLLLKEELNRITIIGLIIGVIGLALLNTERKKTKKIDG